MKPRYLLSLFFAFPLFAAEIRIAEEFDFNRYLGRWYEVARMPNRFEEGCEKVTAEYRPRDDGKITVLNICESEGVLKTANGVATIAGTGKLRVNFVPWLPFAAGDYWVLYVDSEYQLAVVGEPKRKLGWILARTPNVTEAVQNRAIGMLNDAGYATKALIFAEHA